MVHIRISQRYRVTLYINNKITSRTESCFFLSKFFNIFFPIVVVYQSFYYTFDIRDMLNELFNKNLTIQIQLWYLTIDVLKVYMVATGTKNKIMKKKITKRI